MSIKSDNDTAILTCLVAILVIFITVLALLS